jgi:hypothetical protein
MVIRGMRLEKLRQIDSGRLRIRWSRAAYKPTDALMAANLVEIVHDAAGGLPTAGGTPNDYVPFYDI